MIDSLFEDYYSKCSKIKEAKDEINALTEQIDDWGRKYLGAIHSRDAYKYLQLSYSIYDKNTKLKELLFDAEKYKNSIIHFFTSNRQIPMVIIETAQGPIGIVMSSEVKNEISFVTNP